MPERDPDPVERGADEIAVVGGERAVVPVPDPGADDRSLSAVTMGFSCDTGTSASGTWRGLSVADLLDRAAVPEETTHVVLEADDGFRVCVPIRTAMSGVVSVTLDGERIDDARTRFVAPGLDSSRCLRDVSAIEGVSLDPGEDRTEYESIGDDPDGEEGGADGD